MEEKKVEVIKGLMCPGCWGTVELGEGNNILKCDYCETSLLVMGDEGVIQYNVKSKVPKGNVRTTTRKEPVERMILKDYIWNKAACDVSEFGVQEVDNSGISGNLEPFDISAVEKQGMVFEPTYSRTDATLESEKWMLDQAKRSADIDEVMFQKLHTIGKKLSVVYYPLWVIRYKFKERDYQVVVDGLANKLLYGRAPGSTLFRVSMFIGSLMAGNLLLTTSLRYYSADSNDLLIVGAIAGIALIIFGFLKFRYGGEVVEGKKAGLEGMNFRETFNSLNDNGLINIPGVK